MVEAITEVPTAPFFVKGVVSVRGEVVPVVCLRSRMGLPSKEPDNSSRLLVVERKERTIALLVDSAKEFCLLDPSQIEPPPKELEADLVQGITLLKQRTILFLDLARVLEREV